MCPTGLARCTATGDRALKRPAQLLNVHRVKIREGETAGDYESSAALFARRKAS